MKYLDNKIHNEQYRGSGFLKGISNFAKNKIVQGSLAAMLIAGCSSGGGSGGGGNGGGNTNNPPQIITTSVPSANENELYSAEVNTTDADGDLVTCSLTNKPSFLNVRNIGTNKCEVYGSTPEVSADTSFPFTLVAKDPSGSSDAQSYNLLVRDNPNPIPNNPPVITSNPLTSVNENSQYNYQVIATDPDNDPVNCSLTQAPLFLTINPNTCSVSGTAFEVSADTTYPVTVKAEDIFGASVQQNYNLTVQDVPVPIPNNPPQINTSAIPGATENQFYTTQINTSDPDGDAVNCSLTQAPSFLAIGSSTCAMDGTPSDNDSAQTHNVTVRATDTKGAFTDKTFQLYVENVGARKFNIKSLLGSESPVSGAEVKIEGGGKIYTGSTDSSGNVSIPNVLDGLYNTTISSSGFYTHKAGILSAIKSNESKIASLKVIPTTFNMAFFDETSRQFDGDVRLGPGLGKTQRISDQDLDTWKAYIDTNPAIGSGVPITQDMIDKSVDIIENDWYNMTGGKLNVKRANGRLEIGTTPPVFFTDGYTRGTWDDTVATGIHDEEIQNNKIISSVTLINTSSPPETYKQELLQNLGVRRDSNLVPSIFNDPQTVTDYTQIDWDSIKILYNRPIGNTTPDNNPTTYTIPLN